VTWQMPLMWTAGGGGGGVAADVDRRSVVTSFTMWQI
jgi:hypothetical protein